MGCGSSSQADTFASPDDFLEENIVEEPSGSKDSLTEHSHNKAVPNTVISTIESDNTTDDNLDIVNTSLQYSRVNDEAECDAAVLTAGEEIIEFHGDELNEAAVSMEEISVQTLEGEISKDVPFVKDATRRQDRVYEYERWQPFVLWGNTYPGHMLPSDPGRFVSCRKHGHVVKYIFRFSDMNGTVFSRKIKDVATILPVGWHVIKAFEPEVVGRFVTMLSYS